MQWLVIHLHEVCMTQRLEFGLNWTHHTPPVMYTIHVCDHCIARLLTPPLQFCGLKCRLMSQAAARKAQTGRLIIRLATYCDSQDVTTPLQFFVHQSSSSLKLPKGSKAGLLGFYRPTDMPTDVQALLFIRYELGGRLFEITTKDDDPVCLPSPDAVYVGLASLRS